MERKNEEKKPTAIDNLSHNKFVINDVTLNDLLSSQYLYVIPSQLKATKTYYFDPL